MRAKILCCIDNGEASRRALSAAIQLAKQLQGSLTLLSVNPLMPGRGAPITLWPDAYVEEILQSAASKARWGGLTKVDQVRCRALDVSRAIVAHADENEMDYIVLGTRDRSSLARAVGGSVSRAVISKANCPVLAVRRIREQAHQHTRRGLRKRIDLRDLIPARIARVQGPEQ
jgi:nucleotide-binding universal stress UspA family protein